MFSSCVSNSRWVRTIIGKNVQLFHDMVWINCWVTQIMKQFNGKSTVIIDKLHWMLVMHKERTLSWMNWSIFYKGQLYSKFWEIIPIWMKLTWSVLKESTLSGFPLDLENLEISWNFEIFNKYHGKIIKTWKNFLATKNLPLTQILRTQFTIQYYF